MGFAPNLVHVEAWCDGRGDLVGEGRGYLEDHPI